VRLQLKFWSYWNLLFLAPRPSCFTVNHLFESGYGSFCGATVKPPCHSCALTPGSPAAAMPGGRVPGAQRGEAAWGAGGCCGELPAPLKAPVGERGTNTKNRNFQSQ